MHRDIKPDNIGVSGSSEQTLKYILLDFGHATRESSSKDHEKGTLRYLAPEVMALKYRKSTVPYDFRVDIWALGVTALELSEDFRVRDYDAAIDSAELVHRRKREGNWRDEPDQDLTSILDTMLQAAPQRRTAMRSLSESAGTAWRKTAAYNHPEQ